MVEERTHIRSLSRALVDDIFSSMGASGRHWTRRTIKPFIWAAAARFSSIAASFEHDIDRYGFHQAMRNILPNFVTDYDVRGMEDVPREGPLLVVSNHPGTYDSLVIAASLHRDDLSIMATGFSFLRRLPSTSQHLIFSSQKSPDRIAALRASIRTLQRNASLLIFPSGNIDPDPSLMPGLERHLSRWSPSIEMLLKKVPDTRVMVVIVSGMLSNRLVNSPFLRFWRDGLERQKAAGVIQVIRQMLFPIRLKLVPKITFSKPLALELLQGQPANAALEAIIARARQLLAAHIQNWGIDRSFGNMAGFTSSQKEADEPVSE